VAAALATCAGAWPAALASQQLTEAELIRRIEALRPEYEAARAARDERLRVLRAQERPPTPVDTVQIGPIRVVSLPDDVDAARELFGPIQGSFSDITKSPSLGAFTFLYQRGARLRSIEVAPGSEMQIVRVDISRAWAPTRVHAEAIAADAVARVLMHDFPQDSPMRAWLTVQELTEHETAYRAVAAGTSGASRACLAGDVPACVALLGLGMRGRAERLPDWFALAERREMVGAAALATRIDWDDPRQRSCVEQFDGRACDALLAELDWVARPAGSDRLRSHLLWYAARVGGKASWERALERRDAPMPDVLAHMAGRPIEQLVAEWRVDLMAARPDVQAGLGGRGSRVLLWSLIFMAFALRSTRWRLA
jgi:hypothetical protein